MSYHEIETTVLGGLPVTVSFNIQPAEPDVGIFEPYCEDINVVAVKGKKLKWNNWVDKRLIASGEYDRLSSELLYEYEYY